MYIDENVAEGNNATAGIEEEIAEEALHTPSEEIAEEAQDAPPHQSLKLYLHLSWTVWVCGLSGGAFVY